MAKVELKQPIINEIAEAVDGAQSAVLVQYLGITVEQDTALRKELREAGVHYKVYKNTLMKRAFEGTDFAQLDKHLDGPNALAVSKEDAVAASGAGICTVQRSSSRKTLWQHAVPDRKLRSRHQADRRAGRRRGSRGSTSSGIIPQLRGVRAGYMFCQTH